MDCQRRNFYPNPHWKGDPTCVNGPDCTGSLRFPVQALRIIWGKDPKFWKWGFKLTKDETRLIKFREAAVLEQVNWIEITGKLELNKLAKNTTYTISYFIKFQEDAFGWNLAPIKFKVKLNGKVIECSDKLLESYSAKHDVWHEVPGGEFVVRNDTAGIVEFGMFEVETDVWKGCMVLGGVIIKPIGH